jgi:hypothetical protein
MKKYCFANGRKQGAIAIGNHLAKQPISVLFAEGRQ